MRRFLSSDFITAYFKSADCGPLLNHISQKMNVFMRRFFIPRFYICRFKNPQIGAIAIYYFSRNKCFHAQIFYPQVSYLQILNPQIWAISTSRFSKIECFLMDLQTFEEEMFKHSKLFLSIFLRCKRYEQRSTQRSKKGFSYSTRAKEEYAFTKGGLIPNTTKIRVNMPRIPIPTKSLFS